MGTFVQSHSHPLQRYLDSSCWNMLYSQRNQNVQLTVLELYTPKR